MLHVIDIMYYTIIIGNWDFGMVNCSLSQQFKRSLYLVVLTIP
jgi:hypothetical protein